MRKDDPGTYFSLSAEPGEVLTGGRWPCRLFRVEAQGLVIGHSQWAWKRCCRVVHVIEELPAHVALGPQGEAVAEHIAGAAAGDAAWAAARDVAWAAAGAAAWDAAWAAARAAARDAARAAAGDVARAAAGAAAGAAAWAAAGAAAWAAAALVVRDLITAEQFDVLYAPWAAVLAVQP
jgi:hypothetical protein